MAPTPSRKRKYEAAAEAEAAAAAVMPKKKRTAEEKELEKAKAIASGKAYYATQLAKQQQHRAPPQQLPSDDLEEDTAVSRRVSKKARHSISGSSSTPTRRSSKSQTRPPAAAAAAAHKPADKPMDSSRPFNSPMPDHSAGIAAAARRGGLLVSSRPPPAMPDEDLDLPAPPPSVPFQPKQPPAAAAPPPPSPIKNITWNIEPPQNPHQYPVENMNNSNVPPPKSSWSKWWWLAAAVGIVITSIIIIVLASVVGTGSVVTKLSGGEQEHAMVPPSAMTKQTQVCYYTSTTTGDPTTTTDEEESSCSSGEKEWKPCPTYSHCAGGQVVSCHNKNKYNFLQVRDNACVLTTTATETIQAMIQLLRYWTMVDMCMTRGSPYAVKRQRVEEDGGTNPSQSRGRPLFLYTQLCGELELGYDWSLIEFVVHNENKMEKFSGKGDLFVLDQLEDGNYIIGLGDNPSVSVLVLPLQCRAKIALRGAVQATWRLLMFFLLGAIWNVLTFVVSVYGQVFVEIPLLTLFFSVFVPLIGWLVVGSLHRRQTKWRLAHTRNLHRVLMRGRVYETLSAAAATEHPVLLLRDGILFDPALPFAHMTAADRTAICQHVWPAVVSDVAKDNRVRKTKVRTDEGVWRESWKWTSVVDSSHDDDDNGPPSRGVVRP
jgi:hypothetical protein